MLCVKTDTMTDVHLLLVMMQADIVNNLVLYTSHVLFTEIKAYRSLFSAWVRLRYKRF